MNIWSVLWVVSLTLFLGGIGLPVPENPVLVGGGYAIYQKVVPLIPGFCLWYLSILCGDFFLYAIFHYFFRRPALSNLTKRWIGHDRLGRYQNAFVNWGGWTLFLARFTFGIRAVAYVTAGAVGYPWMRFLAVDGVSVAIQVLMFVGLGYYAGERIEWAKATSEKIILLISLAVLLTILTSGLSALMRRISKSKL